jgi:hypothetical protein
VITNPARASSSPSPTARDTPQQLCTFTRTHLCTSSRTPTLLARLKLEHALTDRCLTYRRGLRDGPDATMAQNPGLRGHQQPPLSFVQVRKQHHELQSELVTSLVRDAHTTTTTTGTGGNTLIPGKPNGPSRNPGESVRGVKCGASQSGRTSAYWAYSGVPTTRRGSVTVFVRPPGITRQPLVRTFGSRSHPNPEHPYVFPELRRGQRPSAKLRSPYGNDTSPPS